MLTNSVFLVLLSTCIGVCEGGEICRKANQLTAICNDYEKCCNDDTECCAAYTTGQIAAAGIAAFVVVALVVTMIIAAIVHCNKKSKTTVRPIHDPGVTTISNTGRSGNGKSLYDDLPPQYSLRAERTSLQAAGVSLPSYAETYPTKHKV